MSTTLQSSALVTLAQAKRHLDISGDSKDSLITELINECSSYIAGYCNRTFEEQEFTEYYRGSGTEELVLKNFPIKDGTVTLSENESSDSTDSFDDVSTNDYWVDNENAILTLVAGVFTKRPRKWKVVYTAGYILQGDSVGAGSTALPEEVELAALKLISKVYTGRKAVGVKREKLLDYEVTFAEAAEKDPEVMQVLNNYRTHAI